MITPPAALEALLFASGEPMEKARAATLLGIKSSELARVVDALSKELSSRGITLIETAEELELRTSGEAAEIIKKLRESELSRDLGKAGLESLAVVAYQGGATRGEIDWVRGVNSSTSVRTLLLRGLIEGKEDSADKRRIRYTLTTDALAHLGLSRASELPRHEELSLAAKEIIDTETAALSTE